MESGKLTNSQIVDLARCISTTAMESIALKYLGIEQATIDTLQDDSNGAEAFKRSIIRHWMYRNSGPNQVQVSFFLFYCNDL